MINVHFSIHSSKFFKNILINTFCLSLTIYLLRRERRKNRWHLMDLFTYKNVADIFISDDIFGCVYNEPYQITPNIRLHSVYRLQSPYH